jgi:hypothetical protein
MKLRPVQQKFVLHWGEMGTRWGINRTVAQIHALLYILPKPLNAEEIAERQHEPEGTPGLENHQVGSCHGGQTRPFRVHEGCLGNVPNRPGRAQTA